MQALVDFLQQVFGEQGQILHAFAQWWKDDVDHVQPVVQILPEFAVLHHGFQVSVGRGNDACRGMQGLRSADSFIGAFLKHAQQFGLQVQGQFTQFVQKQGTFCGKFKLAGLAPVGPGEAAFLMAKKFTFKKIFHDGGTVDGQEQAFAFRMMMYGPGHNLLARAAFTGNKHTGLAACNAAYGLQQTSDSRTLADDLVHVHFFVHGHVDGLHLP